MLSALGIPDSYFIEAQQKSLARVTPSRIKDLLQTFSRELSNYRQGLDRVGDFDPRELRGPMQELILFSLTRGRGVDQFINLAFRRGIDLVNDPLISSILSCLQVSNFQQIKRKGRILVPDSANLIGVIDQTGTLEAHEVFV